VNSHFEKNRKAYDKKADHYDSTLDGQFTEKFKKLLMENISINENDSVLDVGCGNGTLLSRIAELKTINGFGIDVSPQMIKNASRRHPAFRFITSGCEEIPFEDNSMDIITVCAAYHHFPRVDVFAREAKRLLKPKGNLYIAEVSFPPIIRHIANIFLPLSKAGDVKFYSSKEIKNTFSNEGFALVKIVKRGYIQIIQLQKIERG
jgi:ubiquinone/menaquinone biosynthesis C-methylase UbiE